MTVKEVCAFGDWLVKLGFKEFPGFVYDFEDWEVRIHFVNQIVSEFYLSNNKTGEILSRNFNLTPANLMKDVKSKLFKKDKAFEEFYDKKYFGV